MKGLYNPQADPGGRVVQGVEMWPLVYLGLWVRIQQSALNFVSFECSVLSARYILSLVQRSRTECGVLCCDLDHQ